MLDWQKELRFSNLSNIFRDIAFCEDNALFNVL